MPQYRRAKGSAFFFTVVLADRSSELLVDQIDRLRRVYRIVNERRPFHRYVERGLLAAVWGGDMQVIQGSFGE